MRLRSAVVVVALIGAAVCGKNQGQNITGASRTATGLTIGPSTDLLKINAVETFSATATYSNGGRDTVQATWASDNTEVATVESPAGHVTGVAPGEATVTAEYQGLRATHLLRVVPDYHGKWSGRHAITACKQAGMWAEVDACEDFTAGAFWFELALTQNRDQITGTGDFGSTAPVEGTVRMTGHLVLAGTFTEPVEDATLEATLLNWETLTMDNEQMSGHFTLQFRMAGVDGSVSLENDLRTVTKTSSIPMAGSREGSGIRGTLSVVLRRLRGR